MDLVALIDRADALIAALIAAGGTWLASRESRRTNLRAALDTSTQETIERMDQRVTALEQRVGLSDAYAAYAISEMRRVEDHMESHGLHWPPPPPMSFYAWLNEQHKLN